MIPMNEDQLTIKKVLEAIPKMSHVSNTMVLV